MGKRIYMTDKELCSVLLITEVTLWRILSGYYRGGEASRRTTLAAKVLRIGDAQPETFGGFRRWKVANVAKILGITEAEIIEALA